MPVDKKILAVVPARGGSKGLRDKNLALVAGQSLVGRSIKSAMESKYIDEIYVSTDSREIMEEAKKAGVNCSKFRPAELATDEAKVTDVVLHVLSIIPREFDYVVLLQPTSPFRTAAHVDSALEICIGQNASRCVSVCQSAKPIEWALRMDRFGHLIPATLEGTLPSRRQDCQQIYYPNGAIYIASATVFREDPTFFSKFTKSYIMDEESSIDIDDERSLQLAQLIASATFK